jgi:glycine betaine monooxygenase B
MTAVPAPVAVLDAASPGTSPAGSHVGLTAHPSVLPVWGGTEDSTLVCRQVLDITHDVKTFLFRSEHPALFHYDPGQFITLRLQIGGRTVERCYTISTPPTRPHLIGITVKRQPGGIVSPWLHDTLGPGQRISADGPFGLFSAAHHPAGRYLFLSAGSGVTPLMSMTRTLFDLGSDTDVLFVHSARTPSDIVFQRELDAMASTAPTIRVAHVCERDSPREPWTGLRGLLSGDMLRVLAPDLHEREVFCCGPAPYMAAVRRLLVAAGFDMARYHEESFSFPELPTAQPLARPGTDGAEASRPTSAGARTTAFSVEFVRTGRTFACGADENVLDAASAAGLTPPSSCGQGLCGTCKTTLLSGTVDMHHQGGIRPREIAQDKLLICCSKPLSDLRIDA